eukprot:366021-Chlamydomonas_euryale.AAC.21
MERKTTLGPATVATGRAQLILDGSPDGRGLPAGGPRPASCDRSATVAECSTHPRPRPGPYRWGADASALHPRPGRVHCRCLHLATARGGWVSSTSCTASAGNLFLADRRLVGKPGSNSCATGRPTHVPSFRSPVSVPSRDLSSTCRPYAPPGVVRN